MPDVLGESQFIMLEKFETIYISTNRTVLFISHLFIAGSAISCYFMPNDRSLWGSSLIPSLPPQKHLCHLKLALYTCHKAHMSCFRIGTYLLRIFIKASYTKWTHFIVVARVPVLMRDHRIFQKFCWMPEAKWPFTTS